MRMLLHVKLPHEPFNTAVKDGTAGTKMRRILDERSLRRCTLRSSKVAGGRL